MAKTPAPPKMPMNPTKMPHPGGHKPGPRKGPGSPPPMPMPGGGCGKG